MKQSVGECKQIILESFCIYIYIYISKGLQSALTAITIVALWQLPHLGHGMCVYTLFGLHCEVTRVLKLRTVSDALCK